jgi:hypothetical protein
LFGGRLRSMGLDLEHNDDEDELPLDFIIGGIMKDHTKTIITVSL